MSSETARDAAVYAVLAAFSVPVLFYGLGEYSATHMDELLYHYVARRMLETGNFFRLEFAGEPRLYDAFMNAPIHYWAKAGVIALLGDGRVSMRLLSAGFGLAAACATASLVMRLESRRAGLLAGLLLLTTFQFVHLHGGRTGEMETLIAFVLVLAAGLFLSAAEGRRSFTGHHLCLVVLAHLKLPLVVLPIAAELLWFAATPAARSRLRAWALAGLWALPAMALWRVVLALHDPAGAAQVAALMWAQATGDAPKVSREHTGALGNAGFYLRTLVFGAFPQVLVHPLALVAVLRERADPQASARYRLLALYVACVLVFFLFVSKHFPWYVMPVHAFLCAFTAVWLDRLLRGGVSLPSAAALGGVFALGLWLRVPGLDYDPFTAVVRELPELGFAGAGGLAPWIGVPATAALLAGLAVLVRGRRLAAGVACVLLVVGGARVLAPLRFVAHESEIEKLRARVEAARAQGEELPNPLLYTREPGEWGLTRVWYFFGDDFWVVPRRKDGERSRTVELYDKSRPRPPGVGEAS